MSGRAFLTRKNSSVFTVSKKMSWPGHFFAYCKDAAVFPGQKGPATHLLPQSPVPFDFPPTVFAHVVFTREILYHRWQQKKIGKTTKPQWIFLSTSGMLLLRCLYSRQCGNEHFACDYPFFIFVFRLMRPASAVPSFLPSFLPRIVDYSFKLIYLC